MKKRRTDREAQYDSPAYCEAQRRIARNLRLLRDAKGWSQAEAAAQCGMPLRLYQRAEGRESNITLTTLARLVEGFEVDLVALLVPTHDRSAE